MDRLKIWMFNRQASSKENRPDRIIEALSLQPGQNVADIGVGGGYYSLRFARTVGSDGIVYGVDTNRKFLEHLSASAAKKGLANVKTIEASSMITSIPAGSLDTVFMRNVFHHLKDRARYFEDLSKLLKTGGRVAIIDYAGDVRHGNKLFRRPKGHHVSKERILE